MASRLGHLAVCSDDEEFAILGGATESEPDTDELMGDVDWTLEGASGSGEEGTLPAAQARYVRNINPPSANAHPLFAA